MKTFEQLLTIDPELRAFFTHVEEYFLISIDKEIVGRIFNDSEEDQVNEKQYEIYTEKKRWLRPQMKITGKVDEHEPETLWIEIQNIKEKDLKHLKAWIEDRPFVLHRQRSTL